MNDINTLITRCERLVSLEETGIDKLVVTDNKAELRIVNKEKEEALVSICCNTGKLLRYRDKLGVVTDNLEEKYGKKVNSYVFDLLEEAACDYCGNILTGKNCDCRLLGKNSESYSCKDYSFLDDIR